jgi:hypothetical protein
MHAMHVHKPMPRKSHIPVNSIWQQLNSCEPHSSYGFAFPVVTPDGKYLLLVEDEYTRYAFQAVLQRKSDAAARIMKSYVL